MSKSLGSMRLCSFEANDKKRIGNLFDIAQSYYYSILQLSNVTGLSETFVETISKFKLRKET